MGLLEIENLALRKLTDRKPLENKRKLNLTKIEKLNQTSHDNWKSKPCMYCSKKDHTLSVKKKPK